MQLNSVTINSASLSNESTKISTSEVETKTEESKLKDDIVTLSGESEQSYHTYGSGGVDIPDPPKEK